MMWGYSMNIIDDVGIFKEYYYKVLRIVIVIAPLLPDLHKHVFEKGEGIGEKGDLAEDGGWRKERGVRRERCCAVRKR